MKITNYALALSAVALTGTASAEREIFFGGSYGFASDAEFSEDAYNAEGLISLELGTKYALQNNFALSLSAELFFANTDLDEDVVYDGDTFGVSTDVANIGFLTNVRLSYEPVNNLSVYIGGGIGSIVSTVETEYSFLETNNSFSDRGRESLFIYQVTAGVEYRAYEHVAFFAQYRYLSGQDFANFDSTAIDDSFVEAGARFYF